MKENGKHISVKKTIIIVFLIAMLIASSSIGYLVFANWFSSAKQAMESIAGSISESINGQIMSLIHVPDHVNEMNHKIIENGILDLSDDKHRDSFFVGVLSANNEEIYSFSYGTANGEYYGARRNEHGVIEIMKNNASTGGNSLYYAVNEDMTASELVLQAGQFDPRTRAWYKAAETAGQSTFSTVYKHFVMDDMTISAAWPIYDGNGQLQGVLGTHMLLTGIGTYLRDTVEEYDGYALIIEKETGALIANSMGMDNFAVLQDGTFNRYSINEIENNDIKKAYAYYQMQPNPHFVYAGEHEKFDVNIQNYIWRALTGWSSPQFRKDF